MAKKFTAEEVINLYKEGWSHVEVAAYLEMTKRQFEKKYQTDPYFRQLVEMGGDLAEAWNVREGRVNLNNKDYNTTLYKARMGHFFGWADKIDQNTKQLSVSATMTKEDVLKKIHEYMPELIGALPQSSDNRLTIEGEVSNNGDE